MPRRSARRPSTPRDDRLYGGKGDDTLNGGDGDDVIRSHSDKAIDTIYCGDGAADVA